MTKLKFDIAISLDGYMAGPDQGPDDPMGVGGMQIHEWVFELAAFHAGNGDAVNESTPVVESRFDNIGACIMGRNMFGGGPGDWGDGSWRGWWGEDPPYHAPVYVLTHFEREPLEMEGGTTFHFVTDGIESAFGQAKEAAGDKDISLSGGAEAIRQYLAAGLVDEFRLSVAPVILGAGEKPLDGLASFGQKIERTEVIEAPGVTHMSYRVLR